MKDFSFSAPFQAQRRQGLRLIAGALFGLAALPAAWAGNGAGSTGELERALEKLLKERPELVRDALNTLEQREADARLRSDQLLLRESTKLIYALGGATVLGNPAGDVTLVEFIDYRCGYCRHLQAEITQLIRSDAQLRVLLKHLPILGPESLSAAELVLAAGQGPQARQLHQRLMSGTPLSSAGLQALRRSSPAAVLDKAGVARGLAEVRQLAERLRIDGTPALLVGDQLMRGAVEPAVLLAAVQAARLQPGKPRAPRA